MTSKTNVLYIRSWHLFDRAHKFLFVHHHVFRSTIQILIFRKVQRVTNEKRILILSITFYSLFETLIAIKILPVFALFWTILSIIDRKSDKPKLQRRKTNLPSRWPLSSNIQLYGTRTHRTVLNAETSFLDHRTVTYVDIPGFYRSRLYDKRTIRSSEYSNYDSYLREMAPTLPQIASVRLDVKSCHNCNASRGIDVRKWLRLTGGARAG